MLTENFICFLLQINEKYYIMNLEGITMYRLIPKRTIQMREDDEVNQEFQIMILCLELCREANDDLWKQLMICHLDELSMLNGSDGKRIRNEIRRKLNGI